MTIRHAFVCFTAAGLAIFWMACASSPPPPAPALPPRRPPHSRPAATPPVTPGDARGQLALRDEDWRPVGRGEPPLRGHVRSARRNVHPLRRKRAGAQEHRDQGQRGRLGRGRLRRKAAREGNRRWLLDEGNPEALGRRPRRRGGGSSDGETGDSGNSDTPRDGGSAPSGGGGRRGGRGGGDGAAEGDERDHVHRVQVRSAGRDGSSSRDSDARLVKLARDGRIAPRRFPCAIGFPRRFSPRSPPP